VIDVQKAIDHSSWGERNNPDAEQNIAALLATWRSAHRPIYQIRHDSTEPDSHYRPGQPGNDFKPEAQPLAQETIVVHASPSGGGTGRERGDTAEEVHSMSLANWMESIARW
jgi:nicotinamidase-related amidase